MFTAEVTSLPPKWLPVQLAIVIETEEQVAKLYTLFNHTYIIDALDLDAEARVVRQAFADNVCTAGLDYHQYHRRLDRLFGR